MTARGEPRARHFEPSAVREVFGPVLLRSKKSDYELIASECRFSAARYRTITSGDELEKSDGRFKERSQDFEKSCSGFRFVRDESSASGWRFEAVLFPFFASSDRSFASTRPSSDGGQRSLASREGVTTGGAGSAADGPRPLVVCSHPSMVTCPSCPLSRRSKWRRQDVGRRWNSQRKPDVRWM
jgi:hypothetical protein